MDKIVLLPDKGESNEICTHIEVKMIKQEPGTTDQQLKTHQIDIQRQIREVGAGKQCRHIKAGGIRCRANARRRSTHCFFHDPASVNERAAARTAGGKERSRTKAVLAPDTPDAALTSAADVTSLLAETINQIRKGEIDPRISNAIGYLAAILLKAKQQDELDHRLKRLETILDSQRTNCKTDVGSTFSSEPIEFVNPTSEAQQ